MEKYLPEIQSQFNSEIHPLWIRISAFLDLKSKNTQRTYKGILKEWCQFLGAEAGSAMAAEMMLKATDLHAIAYRNWLTKQPGQKPRFESSLAKDKHENLPTNVSASSQTNDGTMSTLTNSTISKKIAALRRIYKMLISASEIDIKENPFDTDKIPPPPAKAGQKRPTEMLNLK